MWLFKHKFHADGTLNRYKARLVANGSSQQLGVNFDETFSPVMKPATIHMVLSLAVSSKCLIHQLDIKNSFLNSDLLDCYNDVDLAGCPSTSRSTSGYCVFLGYNLLSWSSKRQHTLSHSNVEVEYWGVANVVSEIAWLHNPLCELYSPLSTTTFVYCDNVRVLHVPSRYQLADVFTKGLPSALFEEFRSSLSVHLPLAPTARTY
ncbi:ribonuclease H-like domain-containing protein [Tanacetum coccineum]